MQTGMFEENFMASRSIKEFSIRGRENPYLQEITREPKSFQLNFAFQDTWNDDLISEIARWLDVEFYQPLTFSESEEKVYYVMPVNDSSLIHNGLKQGYISLTMRCDSPYSYSHMKVTPWYDCKNLVSGYFISPYQFVEDTTIEGIRIILNNYGDKEILPEVWIEKVGTGNISIFNTSYKNEEFAFTNLLDTELIYINGENEIIETNLPNTWRYDSFNDQYLNLYYGKNILQIKGECKLKFQYREKFII
jgi:predicted phage tail component-like protein